MLITIFGRRGSGKTHLIRKNLEKFPGPVAVVDILGNFIDEDEMPEGFQHTDSISEFVEWLDRYSNSEDQENQNKIFVLTPDDPNEGLDFACAALWEIQQGTLVLDEVDGFRIAEVPYFDKVIRYGRNRDIHLVTGCRRPAEISKNITAGADRVFIYRTTEPRDIEYYKSTVLDLDAEKLMTMPKYHGLFADHQREIAGTFRVDEDGNVIILEKKPI